MRAKHILPQRVVVLGALVCSLSLAIVVREIVYSRSLDQSLTAMDDILDNAIPSVRYLVSLRGDLRLALVLADEADVVRTAGQKAEIENRAEVIHNSAQQHFASYAECPLFPHEVEGQCELRAGLAAVHSAALLLSQATDERAERTSDERVHEAVNASDRVIEDLILLNADGASKAARAILEDQECARRMGLALLGGCLVLAVTVGALAERRLAVSAKHLQRHIAELDAFAVRVAHDLKGPLAPAVMAVELLRRNDGVSEKGHKTVETLGRNLARLASIIDGLLAYARASGELRPREPISIECVVNEVAPALHSLAIDEKAELRFDVEPELRVNASKAALSSVFENLIRNALIYLGDSERRRVNVTARSHGSLVTIEVNDTGPGIPPDLLRRLFRPFERGSTRPGTGLGLATVKRLVEAHKGRVTVRSQVGAGTTFVVQFPSRRPH
jgi:signal transduction histidine kinase